MQTLPDLLPPALFGLTSRDAPLEDYVAGVLAAICAAAAAADHAAGGGLLVNYDELPQALGGPHPAALRRRRFAGGDRSHGGGGRT